MAAVGAVAAGAAVCGGTELSLYLASASARVAASELNLRFGTTPPPQLGFACSRHYFLFRDASLSDVVQYIACTPADA